MKRPCSPPFSSSKKPKTINFGDNDNPEESPSSPQLPVPGSLTRQSQAQELLKVRQQLPVWKPRQKILQEIDNNDTVIILAETGSGKSTQIPQFILTSSCPKKNPSIAVTQPRRVAATTLAARVSKEAGCNLGTTVGYTVRFDDKSTAGTTKLKYLTDGTLLQEMLTDPFLYTYDVIILDEAHERSLRTDMLLGFLKKLQKRRKTAARPLKIIVMSATLDAEKFSEFFDNAKILYIQGRQHPVTTHYCVEPQSDYLESALKTIFDIHINHPPGDILVFLTGQDDIENLQSSIQSYSQELPISFPKSQKIQVCPLYATLGPVQQAKAFTIPPPGTRKVVLSTNIAETSVTIPGITYVIDTGLAKQKEFKPGSGVESLLVQPISRSAARQRSGRAGREKPGQCFRLYTKETFKSLEETTTPEIQRVSLSFAILHLIATGYDNVEEFDFLDPPDRDAILSALKNLWAMGAIDNKKKITKIGKQMASLPLDPTFSKILLSAFEKNCASQIIDLVSIISHLDKLFIFNATAREKSAEARQKFVHRDGDHLTLLNILLAYEQLEKSLRDESKKEREAQLLGWCKEHFISKQSISNISETRKQIRQRCERLGLDVSKHSSSLDSSSTEENDERILECVFAGLFENTALRKPDGIYQNVKNRMEVKIHPSSVLHGKSCPAIVYNELVFTSATYARCVSTIRPSWLQDKTPLYSQNKSINSQ